MRPLGGFLKIKNAMASTMIIDSKPDARNIFYTQENCISKTVPSLPRVCGNPFSPSLMVVFLVT